MSTTPTPPGWYPDPRNELRWWDGTQWGMTADAARSQPPGAGPGATSDNRTVAMLAHLLTIFTGFLAPLVIYLTSKDDPYVRHHAAESLNFQITVLLAFVVSGLLLCLLIGFLLLPAVWIGALVFEIIASVAANRGEWYRYPINIRMVSGAVG
jgi:uncharacterized protein